MALIEDFEESPENGNSSYNIYTLSFNNIKDGPNKFVELGRHLSRIIRLENNLNELKKQFETLVDLPEPNLKLVRRSLEAHSTFRWMIKIQGKWSRIGSYDPKMKSYLESIKDDIARKTIESYLFEVELINQNLRVEWARYQGFCMLVRHPDDEVVTPKNLPELMSQAKSNLPK